MPDPVAPNATPQPSTPPAAPAPAAASPAQESLTQAAPASAAPAPDKPVTPDWPDDWRTKISADEKQQKTLQRFASPKALYDSYTALRQRMDSGEVQTKLPENPKPEELAQWRKDNGIPESPDKYDLKFDDGLVIGTEDKPIIDAFLKTAHETNMQPQQVKAAVQWYYKEQERLAEVQAQQDETQRLEALDKLNAEWGTNFRSEMNLIKGSVLSMFPKDAQEALAAARLPDGRGVFNDPEIIRAFAAIAHQINPAGIVTPSGSGDMAQTALSEYQEIQKVTGTKAYQKDAAKQERMRELIGYLHKNGIINDNGDVIAPSQRKAA